MTKHTPGPWEIGPLTAHGAWIEGPTGEWAAIACGDTDASALANARLIAAAPELLEAAKAAVLRGDKSSYRALEAAISKAEGATP